MIEETLAFRYLFTLNVKEKPLDEYNASEKSTHTIPSCAAQHFQFIQFVNVLRKWETSL